jgi:hypothetical protein
MPTELFRTRAYRAGNKIELAVAELNWPGAGQCRYAPRSSAAAAGGLVHGTAANNQDKGEAPAPCERQVIAGT